eukprot:6475469-Amphidinium_carterae.3
MKLRCRLVTAEVQPEQKPKVIRWFANAVIHPDRTSRSWGCNHPTQKKSVVLSWLAAGLKLASGDSRVYA